jgi:hypothetical protein
MNISLIDSMLLSRILVITLGETAKIFAKKESGTK